MHSRTKSLENWDKLDRNENIRLMLDCRSVERYEQTIWMNKKIVFCADYCQAQHKPELLLAVAKLNEN